MKLDEVLIYRCELFHSLEILAIVNLVQFEF